jgi:hypothetical protein
MDAKKRKLHLAVTVCAWPNGCKVRVNRESGEEKSRVGDKIPGAGLWRIFRPKKREVTEG